MPYSTWICLLCLSTLRVCLNQTADSPSAVSAISLILPRNETAQTSHLFIPEALDACARSRVLPDILDQENNVTTTTEQQNAINVAAIQVEVAHLKLAVAELRTTNVELDRKLDQVLAQLAEARGGWRTLMLIGGAAGTLGSGFTWLFSQWRG